MAAKVHIHIPKSAVARAWAWRSLRFNVSQPLRAEWNIGLDLRQEEESLGDDLQSIASPEEEDFWDSADVEQLGFERFDVTDPVVFKEVDDAFNAGDYDKAQELIDNWKAEHVQKAEEPALVALSRIRTIDPKPDTAQTERTRRGIRAGRPIKPIDLHDDPDHPGHYVVANGEHRLEAHKLEGKTHVLAILHGPADAEHKKLLPKEDMFEGPNQPKKKRKLQTPAGQIAMDHNDIASDSSSIAFDSGVMNEMNAPIDRV